MPKEKNPSGKFQLITETPLPNKCIACGKEGTGSNQFVDFGVSLDYVGAILICYNCCTEMAELVDYVPCDEADEANVRVMELLNELEQEKQNVIALDTVISEYYRSKLFPDGMDSVEDSQDSDDNSAIESDADATLFK